MSTGAIIIFYLLAVMTLAGAVLAVTTRHIFRAAIYLLFTLIGVAGFYFWLSYEFVAAVQIVVYAGGIAVLIIFSIFLTQRSGEELPRQKGIRNFFAALAVFCGFALTMREVLNYEFTPSASPAIEASVANIGKQMLSIEENGYALPFEVISMLLLAAMIGCIVIALKSKTE